MIKKIILAVISAIAVYFTYVMIKSGMNVESRLPIDVDILSYQEIINQGAILNEKIEKMGTLNSVEIMDARNNVETEKANFEDKQMRYNELENNASEEEIAEANKKQEYLLDYLWIVIGNYANDNDVKFKMTTDEINLRINFDITGSYISIINFIYDLENDVNLKFNLNGIKIATGASEDSTKANFFVDGVTVKTTTSANR